MSTPYIVDSEDNALRAFPEEGCNGIHLAFGVSDAGYRALALVGPTVRLLPKTSSAESGAAGDRDAGMLPRLPFDNADDNKSVDGAGNGEGGLYAFWQRMQTRSSSPASEAGSDADSFFSCESTENGSVKSSPVLLKRPPLLQSQSMPVVNVEHELQKLQAFDQKYFGIKPTNDDSSVSLASARRRCQSI